MCRTWDKGYTSRRLLWNQFLWGSSGPLCCRCTWDSNLYFTWMSCTLHNCTLHMYHTICRFITRRQRGRNPFSLCNYFVFWSGGARPISFLKYKTVYIHIPCCQNIPRVDDQFSCHRIESLQSHDLFVNPGSSGQTIPVASWDFLWRSSSIHLLYLQQKTFSQNYGSHILLSWLVLWGDTFFFVNNIFTAIKL